MWTVPVLLYRKHTEVVHPWGETARKTVRKVTERKKASTEKDKISSKESTSSPPAGENNTLASLFSLQLFQVDPLRSHP